MKNGKRPAGVWGRLIETIAAWEDAMDYTASDYALDRITNLELEVARLKGKLTAELPRHRQ
jgi:hypothetical protein